MNLNRKRQRIVSFRVSEAEYESLRAASEIEGAHSISEYARRTACATLVSEPGDVRLAIHTLGSRLDELQAEMRRISSRMDERLSERM